MVKKYIVNLSAEERTHLEQFTTTGRHAADQITRARIILKADADQPGGSWCDEEICAVLDVGVSTVERVRRRFVEVGLAAALKRQPGGGRKHRCLDGEQEAHLIQLVAGFPSRVNLSESLYILAILSIQTKKSLGLLV